MGGGGYLCDCVEMTRDLRWGEEATFVTVLRWPERDLKGWWWVDTFVTVCDEQKCDGGGGGTSGIASSDGQKCEAGRGVGGGAGGGGGVHLCNL